ncbi:ADP-ribosyltransferase [Methanosphaera cuniculi]|uniref:ADP-ribosyltransferase exoenzyme n=1 Tax=Methanosphaera cuniculi TaxID=1077256 RepID=A0A2A2HDY8_9EURY|nr:ADP-ribosyltransferase [Methanosphaera cuniculi]PAV07607.1 hypothetical protein ASJ82_07995 [Methanosphaera cuniculi]PWL08069.1 ADP-ribosyltransferase exoenzyme [Methanosphaera cuniculi]
MEIHNFTKKHFKELPEDIQKGFQMWTGDEYKLIRKYFDSKETLTKKENRIVQNMLKAVDGSFTKLKIPLELIRGDRELWLYEKGNVIKNIKNLKIGEVYHFGDNSYISTSLGLTTPLDPKYSPKGGIIFKLLAPPGTETVPILQNSNAPEEAEIILKRGQEIQILDIDESNENKKYITAKIINNKKDIINKKKTNKITNK